MENKEFIDLGEKLNEAMTPEPISGDKTHYPCLYFSNKEGLKNLPTEGTAVIRYKKVMEREEKSKRNGKEETRYTTELEIHAIKAGEASESEAEKADEPSDEDAIDKGLEAASESKETQSENE